MIISYTEWSERESIINSIASEIEYAIQEGYDIDAISQYLFEEYSIELDLDLLIEDLNQDTQEQPPTSKPSTGSKIGGHLKRNWKKYAAGAGVAALGVGALNLRARHLGKQMSEDPMNAKWDKYATPGSKLAMHRHIDGAGKSLQKNHDAVMKFSKNDNWKKGLSIDKTLNK